MSHRRRLSHSYNFVCKEFSLNKRNSYVYAIHAIRAAVYCLWFRDSRLQLAVSLEHTRIACHHKPHSVQFAPPTLTDCNPTSIRIGLPCGLDVQRDFRKIYSIYRKVFKDWRAIYYNWRCFIHSSCMFFCSEDRNRFERGVLLEVNNTKIALKIGMIDLKAVEFKWRIWRSSLLPEVSTGLQSAQLKRKTTRKVDI